MNQRLRTDYFYNLDLIEHVEIDVFPIIKRTEHIPKELIGFNYVNTNKQHEKCVHFYLDDYQFERVWNKPDFYTDKLLHFDSVFTPDFSLYLDMPMPLQIFNTYRNRLLGAYWKSRGLEVIATLSWSDDKSYSFCFEGVEPGGVVTVSTVGCGNSVHAKRLFLNGLDEMVHRLEPKKVLVYGKDIGIENKRTEFIYFDNETIKRIERSRK